MNPNAEFSFFLASQSPRRKQLLAGMELVFRASDPISKEAFPERGQAGPVALLNAVAKAESLAHLAQDHEIVLGADTLVVLDGFAIGKPKDRDDAKQILKSLSGKQHQVVSAIYLWSRRFGERRGVAESKVTFHNLSNEEIEQYVLLKEPYDKAGAYAVQGASSIFIHKIEGSYSNVMGLPIELLIQLSSSLLRRTPFDLFEKV